MEQFAVGLLCRLLVACGPPAIPRPLPPPNPNVTVYQVSSHPAVTQLTYDQVAAVGLDCNQKDMIISVLENKVSNQPVEPDSLPADQRRLNSITRSKIWQLRTYCQ